MLQGGTGEIVRGVALSAKSLRLETAKVVGFSQAPFYLQIVWMWVHLVKRRLFAGTLALLHAGWASGSVQLQCECRDVDVLSGGQGGGWTGQRSHFIAVYFDSGRWCSALSHPSWRAGTPVVIDNRPPLPPINLLICVEIQLHLFCIWWLVNFQLLLGVVQGNLLTSMDNQSSTV